MGVQNRTIETVDLQGSELQDYIRRFFKAGSSVKYTFHQFDPSDFILKFSKIGGEDIYPFSAKHTELVNPKFDLKNGYEYYVWCKDLKNFNNMSAEEQLAYFETVKFNDDVIGKAETSTIQKIIAGLISTEVEYNIAVNKSIYIWWEFAVSGDVVISICPVSYMSDPDISATVTGYRYRRVDNSFETRSRELFNKIGNTQFTEIKIEEDRANYVSSYLKISIYGYVKVDRINRRTILFQAGYRMIDNKVNIIFAFGKTLSELLQDFTFPRDRITKMVELNTFIQTFAEALQENEQTYKTGEAILNALS